MSVSFMWEEIRPERAKAFSAGLSSDIDALKETFGNIVSSVDLPVLRAMHRATRQPKTLWSEMADTLERLSGDECAPVSLKVWTEF